MPSGFTVSHIEPDEVRRSPSEARLMFWAWALDLVIAAKDREIAEGLQADGTPMRPIAAATRKHRRSAMTASGKGDPSAPPLTPGRKLSRTRSLLAGNAYPDRVEVYWLFDAYTGDTWSRVLTYQADHGRDVFGLAPKDLERIRLQLLGKWIRWTRSGRVVPDEVRGRQVVTAQMAASRGGVARPVHVTPPGSTDLTHATTGIGTSASTEAAIRSGNWSGGMTEAQLRAFATGGAAANVQSGPGAAYNRLLSHVWGGPARGPSTGVTPLMPPKPPAPRAKPLTPPATAQGRQKAKANPAEETTLQRLRREATAAGYPVVPRDHKEAADQIVAAFVAQDEKVAGDPAFQAKIRANYRAEYRTTFSDDEAMHANVQAAINRNYANPEYRAAVAKYGAEVVVPLKRHEKEKNEARRRGVVTEVVNWGSLQSGTEDAKPRAGVWSTSEYGGLTAVLRHEYGHRVDDLIKGEQRLQILAHFPELDTVREDLTQYGAKSYGEAFAEWFSLVTNPLFDPAASAPWISKAYDAFKGLP